MTPSDDTPSAASEDELRTIQTSRGAYRLVRRIGRGGFGKVYEAEAILPLGQRRRCAIKFMAENLVANKLAIEQFAREARTGIKVTETSLNLVTTTDFGECPERGLFLVMQLIEGPSLATARGIIRDEMPLIRRIAWDGLAGLAHLHGHGLIHHDVSPSNLLLAQDGMVKLTDFGLTKPPNQRWERESVAGVSGFIAPELRLLREATPKSDLYSLGAVLYDLIVGNPPYSEIVTGVGSRPAPSLPENIPADIEQVVLGLVVIDPELRMSSAEAIELLGDAPRATNDVIIQLAASWRRCRTVLREGESQTKTQPDHSSAELIRALSQYEPPGAMQAPDASPLWKENRAQDKPQSSQAEPLLGAELESQPASTRAADAAPGDSCPPPDEALFVLPPMSSEHPPLNPARTSAGGTYTLLHTIGSGGMAKVYAAERRVSKRKTVPCAIKFMYPNQSRDAFSKQALAGWQFADHPNLVAVHDWGVWPGGIPYQVMERVNGPNLAQACKGKLRSKLRYNPVAARRIALDVATALRHLHLHDTLHCDVSPVNILLSAEGNVKLADLGVSRRVSENPMHPFRGLPAFASREALMCETIDPISDAYSLGAVLFWLLTGKPPYDFGDPLQILHTMKTEPLPSLPDGTPPDLITLIRALLTHDRRERPSVDDVIDALGDNRDRAPVADTAWIAVVVEQWRSSNKPAEQPAASLDVAEPDRKTDKQAAPVDAVLRQYVEQQANPQNARPSLGDDAPPSQRETDERPLPSRWKRRIRWLAVAGVLVLLIADLSGIGGGISGWFTPQPTEPTDQQKPASSIQSDLAQQNSTSQATREQISTFSPVPKERDRESTTPY